MFDRFRRERNPKLQYTDNSVYERHEKKVKRAEKKAKKPQKRDSGGRFKK
jgi:hypothetical protein